MMQPTTAHQHCSPPVTVRRGFSLTELLVAMGIIAIIAGITAIGIRNVTREARISSATNTISAALDSARALAIQRNRTVVVAFRPRLDRDGATRLEIITAEFAGDSEVRSILGTSPMPRIIDRFRPIPGIGRRELPRGIGVAGPFHAVDERAWLTSTDLGRPQEAPGRVIGIMYRADGTTVLQDSSRNTHFVWIDVNDDGERYFDDGTNGVPPSNNINDWMTQKHPDDEPLIQMVQFLAVYDHDAAREWGDTSVWTNAQNWTGIQGNDDWPVGAETREAELSLFITENAERIHFNRYTGVMLR